EMKHYRNIQLLLFALLISIVPVNSANAGNIVPGNIHARFFDTHSRINFGLAQGDVMVTDDAVTGYAWAEDWGWINFAPTLGGVENDGNGNLSGYAWGETLGWINFNPTLGGVTIDEDGFFSGYAWAENGGWIEFNCAEPDACVETTWSGDEDEGGDDGGGGGGGQQAPGEGGGE